MAKMISNAPHYTDERLYKEGEIFEYDGPESTAFHKVGGQPLTRESINATMSKINANKLQAATGERAAQRSLDALRLDVSRDNMAHRDELRAKEEQIANLQKLADQSTAKDQRIANLEKQLADAKAAHAGGQPFPSQPTTTPPPTKPAEVKK